MSFWDLRQGRFYQGDCLEIMRQIPDGVIDMVLCDLPYGTTACKWDSVIPFEPLWKEYWRVAKPNAAIVLTASQPFTTALIASQIERFKYEWIWSKNIPTGQNQANKRPMKSHESVCVFYEKQSIYNKQTTLSKIKDRKLGGNNGKRAKSKASVYDGNQTSTGELITLKENVSPRSVIEFDCVPRSTGTIHPTQKPVALFEYLIRTYTDEGAIVLDNCAGSGTTAIAAINTNRKWCCIEQDETYTKAALKRIEEHVL